MSRYPALSELKATLAHVADGWSRHDVPRLSAALAYYALFSLAPLLVVAMGIAGFVFGAEAARGEIVSQFSSLIGRAGAEAVEALLLSGGTPGEGALAAALGFATLLFGASGVFGELQGAMHTIWESEPRKTSGVRSFVRRRFLSFAMVLGSGFLLLVSLVVSAALAATQSYLVRIAPQAELAWSTANSILGLVLPAVLFACILRILPDAKVPWRHAWTGALFAAALFAIGRSLLGRYLGNVALESSYGAAASLIAVVAWVYYSAQIVFLGAELSRSLSAVSKEREDGR